MPLVTRSNVYGRVATSECWPEVMTHYRKWFLSASIRCKRPRQINAGRSTVIVQGWCWEKALHFWHWKISTSLNSAEISARDVDYINAHGTATVFNDTAEGKAISSLFNGVSVSSTKGMMGHSLGAAGAIEAIVCLLALQHQLLPPNINFATLDDNLDLNIVANEARPAVLHTALSNSFGFGGTNASILMRRSHRRQDYGGPVKA